MSFRPALITHPTLFLALTPAAARCYAERRVPAHEQAASMSRVSECSYGTLSTCSVLRPNREHPRRPCREHSGYHMPSNECYRFETEKVLVCSQVLQACCSVPRWRHQNGRINGVTCAHGGSFQHGGSRFQTQIAHGASPVVSSVTVSGVEAMHAAGGRHGAVLWQICCSCGGVRASNAWFYVPRECFGVVRRVPYQRSFA